jgi:hypothetical protein
MGIHPFQIADLNSQFVGNFGGGAPSGSIASEFALVSDNINGGLSRYLKIMGAWSNVAIGTTNTTADSYDQVTGPGNNGSEAPPARPNAGYFMRELAFAGFNTNLIAGGARNGYIGSYVGGILHLDYTHDSNPGVSTNTPPGVDYETIYGHGIHEGWPQGAYIGSQWLDSVNNPLNDGSGTLTNSGSVYTRTAYMPPSYFLMFIDSAGSQTIGSGNVKFHFENRPSLRMGGFYDGNQSGSYQPVWAGSQIYANPSTVSAWLSDPIVNYAGLNYSTNNYHEYYQVTGQRALNSRGLSFHLAKVFDNGYYAFAYPFEEDGQTLGTGITLSGSNISYPYTYVNDQTEYAWAGGRDKGCVIESVISSGTTVTFNVYGGQAFSTGEIVLIQGLSNGNNRWLNGQLVTVNSGATTTQFTATVTGPTYGQTGDYGVAVFNPDFRVRNAATFVINEEYYGLVMDTKCSIWSNKSSMFPLLFFDLANLWTGSTAKRIGGVAVTGVNPGTITSVAVTSNVATVTVNNNYQAGQLVYIQGLTGATFLNGQTLTVLTASPTQFTAAFTISNYGPTLDNGTAGGYKVWFISEDGVLAVYDFTQANGALSLTGTNAPAPATGEAYGSLAVSADHTTIYALYGTMTADPRTTQTGLASARIGILPYTISTGTWGAATYSTLTGRHNGRNLHEMIVARDGKIYILCEDVSFSAGTVKNAYPYTAGVTAPITQIQVAGNVLTVTATNSFVAGQVISINDSDIYQLSNDDWYFTILPTGLSSSQFEVIWNGQSNYGPNADSGTVTLQQSVNWQVMAYDPVALQWNTSKINGGTTPIQYGGNFGCNGNKTTSGLNSPNDSINYWYYNCNAFLHDVASGQLLVQGNWTGNQLQMLNTSGSTASLSNTNLTYLQPTTIFPYDEFVGYAWLAMNNHGYSNQVNPTNDPVVFIHARDYATNADRTMVWINTLNVTPPGNPPDVPTYIAPPGYNWSSPTGLQLTHRNPSVNYGNLGGGYVTTSYQQDYWTAPDLTTSNRLAWVFPFMLTDNYVTFLRPTMSELDNLPGNATYGRSAAQSICYLPTYWKWTGSQWVMANNWADAVANPYSVPNTAGTPIPLPYGLQVAFGQSNSDSYTQNEFHTFNLCWGNTKYARKMRQSWAQFAGQSFQNQETRTVASQNALSLNFIDTDTGAITWTAPTSTSPSPQTATLTTPSLGWATQAYWNMFDTNNNAFGATPLSLVWTPNTFQQGSFVYQPPQVAPTSSGGFYNWTVNGNAYASQSSGDSTPSWYAFSGCPQNYWNSNFSGGGMWITIKLPTATTVLSYGFRNVWQNEGAPSEYVPSSWTLQGSNDNSTWTPIDSRSGVSPMRSVAYNVSAPGSYQYYRLFINAIGYQTSIAMFRLSTAVLQNTCSFVDLALYAYGSSVSSSYIYPWIRNWQMSRGYTFQVSTTPSPVYPTNYTTITPLWRSHNGYVFSFNRQTNITGLAITVQSGYFWNNNPNQVGFGPFYLLDYGVNQTTLNSARLGISTAAVGTPQIASFDPNCLGVATDVPDISIDGNSPNLLSPYAIYEDNAVHGFWDFQAVPANQFKLHPFFGFMFFEGNGTDNGSAYGALNGSGTNAVINYQWGRRI